MIYILRNQMWLWFVCVSSFSSFPLLDLIFFYDFINWFTIWVFKVTWVTQALSNNIFFSRTTGPILFRTDGPISTKFSAKHPWVKGIQICSNGEPFNNQKVKKGFFLLSINIKIIICVDWIKLFSQVSDVAHGPLVFLGGSECPSSNPTFPKIFLKSDWEIPSHNIISNDLLLWVGARSHPLSVIH